MEGIFEEGQGPNRTVELVMMMMMMMMMMHFSSPSHPPHPARFYHVIIFGKE
jgi:hypothetical protein